MGNKKVLVIGAGIGGLATALRLRKKGNQVTVFEQHAMAGGKSAALHVDGYRFDTLTPFINLPDTISELFTELGYKMEDYLTFKSLDPICKYFYTDGVVINAWANTEKFAREVQIKTNEKPQSIVTQLEKCGKHYQPVSKFISNNNHSDSTVNSLLKGSLFDKIRNTHSANESAFSNRKVQMIFDRYATGIGSNPYKMPAHLNYRPYLDHALGLYYINGGIHRLTETLLTLCKEMGVVIAYNARVEYIKHENNVVTGLRVNGKDEPGDIVVSSIDANTIYLKYLELSKHKIETENLSNSVIVFYWGIGKNYPQLTHNNILFSRYYHEEFNALENGELFYDNTIYLTITSKLNAGDAPEGCENWQVIINAPPDRGQDWDEILKKAREQVLGKLGLMFNANVQHDIVNESYLTPPMIEEKTGVYAGALFGQKPTNSVSSLMGNPVDSHKIKHLYFCGSTVQPAPDLPFSIASSRAIAMLID